LADFINVWHATLIKKTWRKCL